MAKIDVCRICLTEAVERDITQLSEELKGDKKSCWDILLFCLNIQVSPESKLTTKLCVKCFIKIISFHEFKTLALKNNEYLCCLQKRGDKKFNVFEMNNIKCEEMSNGHSDDGICDMEPLGKIEIKNEHNIEDVPSDDELLSVIKKIKDEYVTEACKENKESRPKTKSKGKKVRIRKRDKEPEQREKICEECGKTVVNLFEHMKLHLPAAERKRIQCKVCDKTFASYGARYRHNKIKHLGIKQHCDECGKDVVSLRNHRLVMHSNGNLPHECVPCGRRFISKAKRDLHMVKHTKDRPYVCDMCDKDFRHNIGLLQHKRQVHDKEKTHLCQICSKRFFKKYNLQVHLSSTTIMKNHQMIHSDARNFACDLCDMAFKKPGYLRVHMISHTKEKRYSCTYCDMPFGRSDHRARHERTAHQRPFIQSQNNAPTQLNLQ
ncbi:zinc finger protein 624-like isoform X2 [Pararge aegeria]|uniref:zinc finger protein 624-like isoform X2 n=1 Tax=Pararge aegeria TaxID=116150 RepID=UPI0019D134C3|nr:zinc finger protein 624-like isoform X2 [Pararge aegeria]